MRIRSLLFLMMLATAFTLTACPPDDDDDSVTDDDDVTADDDDTTADDDDATADDDDDDATTDDDDATAPAIACDGSLPVFTEAEPNDDPAAPNSLATVLGGGDGGFCIDASLECGDATTYLDQDFFSFSLPEGRDVNVLMEWNGSSDNDSYLWEASSFGDGETPPLVDYLKGLAGPEDQDATVAADTLYLLNTGCWEGEDGSYTLTVTYDGFGGDDDDSAGDDDDSAGDDDDSAGDDDDSAGDDDDSAR